jgi:hypothetical protein
VQNPTNRLQNRTITKHDMLVLLERERESHLANSNVLFKTYAGIFEHRRAIQSQPNSSS